jgi:hypothetical protein
MSPAGRTASQDPDVHRELIVQDPPQEGRDVANFQRAIKARLDLRGIDVPTPVHGKFTHATWVAAVEAGYFLGLLSSTYLATDKRRGLSTEGAQTIIRSPDKRSGEQLARAKERQGQLGRGPRYYEELASRIAQPAGRGPAAALAFAKRNLGVHETPPGSNWGGKVKDWIELTGYTSPVPWCGCFVNACLVAAGVPNGAGWIGYTPAIIVHAQRGIGGWSWHTDGKPGDLILFDTPGGDPAVHVGLALERLGPGHWRDREGNTSSGRSGSQDNGGVVAERERVSSPAFRMVGFARPPYPA